MDAVVYDIEIIKAIQGKNEDRLEGIEYCNGWHDHEGMGISVIGAYDFVEDRYRTFCEDNITEFLALVDNRKVRISFNGVGFDDKVINSCITCGVSLLKDHYDILREIWLHRGLNPDRFNWRTHGGFGLDAMCQANGLGGKTGNGALAPVQWQRGQIGSVIDYCLQDIKLTKDLFVLSQQGKIKSPKGGELLLRRIENA